MRYITVLLAVLLIVGAGILAAGCTMPEGDGTQQTPMEEETPPGMDEETLIGGEETLGGQAGY